MTQWIVPALFAFGAVWTIAVRRPRASWPVLGIGLVLAAAASIMRTDAITAATEQHPWAGEVTKHAVLTAATFTLLAFVHPPRSRRSRTIMMITPIIAVTSMVTATVAAGPFITTIDLLPQSWSSPIMVVFYWLPFYGATTSTLALLTRAASRTTRASRNSSRVAAWLLTLGAGLATVWGLTGPAAWIALVLGQPEAAATIDDRADLLVSSGSLGLALGLVLPSVVHAAATYRTAGGLRSLHAWVLPATSGRTAVLPRTGTVHAQQRLVETIGALTELQSYAPPGSPAPASVAELEVQVLAAAARLRAGAHRRDSQSWSTWITDTPSMADLGRRLRSQPLSPGAPTAVDSSLP